MCYSQFEKESNRDIELKNITMKIENLIDGWVLQKAKHNWGQDIVHIWGSKLYGKNKKGKRDTRNRVRRSNIHLTEVPEGEVREMGKKMMAQNLNMQLSEAQWILHKTNNRNYTPRGIIVTVWKTRQRKLWYWSR